MFVAVFKALRNSIKQISMPYNPSKEPPRFTRKNGHQVLEAPDGKFKVLSNDGQVGSDFDSYDDACGYARSLRSRDPRNAV
ncbi:hypothetical protein [uncultured Agrobacterium sp.]|uniref:hypothetical protein n=1 Tax=uncultured Agrobacterium sp. TaxID=157277 RepID=UPI0025F2E988|nr:hypothetical protein [uncultured Agrobacterium sp.]